MKTKLLVQVIAVATFGFLPFAVGPALAAAPSPGEVLARQTFALGGARLREPQEFRLETHVVSFAPNGERGVTDIYRLRLKCTPAAAESAAGNTITCLAFTVQFGAETEAEIPALKGLSYVLDLAPDTGRGVGPVLGVPHAPFENLVDAAGRPILPGNAYHVYNAFMDFHAFCDIFPRPIGAGAGVEDLHAVGQKIVHATAFSEPPVNLGGSVEQGSFFKNGEVTLEFKGIGVIAGETCALLGVDSGRSSFAMTMRPAPNLEMKTTGSSHYKGDIYLNLATHWVSRVDADEIVVSETALPMPPHKFDAIIERTILIRNTTVQADAR